MHLLYREWTAYSSSRSITGFKNFPTCNAVDFLGFWTNTQNLYFSFVLSEENNVVLNIIEKGFG